MNTQLNTRSSEVTPLSVSSVLVGSLPAALMTADAPERYRVETVFSRRPGSDEVAEILGDRTREVLRGAGYDGVEVTVEDRRLVIHNTNLEELRDGLATVVADRLESISAGVQARQDEAALRFHDAAELENARAAQVSRLAEAVTFRSSSPGTRDSTPQARSQQADADVVQIDKWVTEGGSRTSL